MAPRRLNLAQIIAVVATLIGTGIFVYPTAADWFARRAQAGALSSYMEVSEAIPDERSAELLAAAHEYNQRLPIVNMVDPYGANSEKWRGDPVERDLYEGQLNVGSDQPMAWLSIKAAGVNLPVYHGTSETTLKKGGGHLFGSSLPVGGPSTRTIITGHSGDPRAKLFTNLHDVKIGDSLGVRVLSEQLYYRIREIKVIEPTEVAGLGIIEGEDLLTLITCTPIGVNSHRLVVTAERIPHPGYLDAAEYPMDPDSIGAGFPWWILPLIGVPSLAGWISRTRRYSGPIANDPDRSNESNN